MITTCTPQGRRLEDALKSVDRALVSAIDSADQCNGESVYHLLKALKSVIERAAWLELLLTSRPETEDKKLKGAVEQAAGANMVSTRLDTVGDYLIVEKRVDAAPTLPQDDVKAAIIESIPCSADASAAWMKIAVELLESRQLQELYKNLFVRCVSGAEENRKLAIAALQILAVAKRPLSILELGWAVALSTADKAVGTVEALSRLVDHHRVMALIQPFIERVDLKHLGEHQVQLMHPSAREFVMTYLTPTRCKHSDSAVSMLPALHQTSNVQQQLIEDLEAQVLAICVRYLLLNEVDATPLFPQDRLALEELPQTVDVFTDSLAPSNCDRHSSWQAWEEDDIHYDPSERGFGEFFVYASCHWVDHFGAISTISLLPKLDDVELLCRAGSMRLQNWIAQNRRPGCAMKPRFVFDSTLYDPLSITSLYGSEAMMRHMLERSDLAGDAFLAETVTKAANQILRWGELSRVRILWEGEFGCELRNEDFFKLALKQWSMRSFDKYRKGWNVVFGLLDEVHDEMVEERWGSRIMDMAARVGCVPVLQQLLDAAQHNEKLKAELLDLSQSENGLVGAAILGNHVEVVEYLLRQDDIGPHLRHRNKRGENMLHLASGFCNPAVFRLLSVGGEAFEKDKLGFTVLVRLILSAAETRDRLKSARMLMSGAATTITQFPFGEELREAVCVAAELGDLHMCRLLTLDVACVA
ncbi:hypothetical protein QBC34DRAFT_403144 [Podospora aff. communis PSN243]|uniref:Uncharacterized protein n=1 Tax=Podospora aff. communis PSN243 TaxID=3040156 RepID=A0AAV9GPJ4_9PEZI|nr:hypothetical protein QBC34DRAFT_403144 [Podospora aff. communis PSN243]